MNKFLLVLVGVLGIGIGLGVAFLVPSLKRNDAAQASVGAVFESDTEEFSEEVFAEVEPGADLYDVIRVVDGDTIAISMDGTSETLRLIGIDTPETVDPRVEVQCFGKEASEKAHQLLDGRKVSLEVDAEEGERDKYDRLLAYVYRDDGLFFNKYMIEQGFAHEYTYDDPYKYQKDFKAAEATAKAAKRGLWAPDACPPATAPVAPTAAKTTPAPTQQSTQPATQPQETQSAPTSESVQSEPVPQPKSEPVPQPQTTNTSTYTCSSNTYNCSDFKTHAEAQAVYEMCGGAPNDVHKLDSNKDGEACESLP